MAKKKFYAVRVGKTPGIYTKWYGEGGAFEQIDGFSGAKYKGFATIDEAKDYLGDVQYESKSSVENKPADVMDNTEYDYEVYTDGGCAPSNPGPGGYGAVITNLATGDRQELYDGYELTTNNRMEMMAVIDALSHIPEGAAVVVNADSKYVINTINEGWKRNKNHDLWERLDQLISERKVTLKKVPAHSGVELNERCDELCGVGREKPELKTDSGYEQ